MLLRAVVAALVILAVGAATVAAAPRHAKRLKAFDSCRALVAYAARHVPPPPPPVPLAPPLPRGAAPRPAPAMPVQGEARGGADSSQTNVQEAGVDEPDIVKTDGSTLFALAAGWLHAVDARAAPPARLDTLELRTGVGETLLLHGQRLLVLGSGPSGTRLTEVDVRDPAHLRVLRTQDLEGQLVDARLTGRTARVVVASEPQAAYGEAALRARPSGWLPRSTVTDRRTGRRSKGRAVGCRSVRRPAVFSGAGVLTVYTVDLAAGLPAVDADAIFTSADTVYASPAGLYAATQRWDADGTAGSTSLHRFDIADPDTTTYAASGSVPGTLLNQFSLSEDKGVLRVATTVGWGEDAESRVTTLSRLDGRLVRRGHVGGLGRGERIFAVRFIGDTGYVVTFRQTDPLYALDLRDPEHPRALGELKIPGYSAYLHPVGPGLLLGVGQDAGASGRLRGLQVSLFDVSDLARPLRLHQLKLGDRFSSSGAEWDHHAFLWWPATGLAVLPVDSLRFSGAAALRVTREAGIAELGRISHPEAAEDWIAPIERALVIGERLLTVSELGVMANGLADLASAGWAAFPQPRVIEPRPGRPRPG